MRNAYNPKAIQNIWQRYQFYLFFSICKKIETYKSEERQLHLTSSERISKNT